MRRATATLWSSIILLGVPAAVLAQAQGRLSGTVLDPAGQPIPGVRATLTAAEVKLELTDETNKKGQFAFAVVDATKSFRIRLEKEGYRTLEEEVDIPIGDVLRRSWTLAPPSGGPAAAVGPAEGEQLKGKQAAVDAFNEGATRYNRGEVAAAVAKFEQATALDPQMTRPYEVLAGIYLDLAQPDRLAKLRVAATGEGETAESIAEIFGVTSPDDITPERAYLTALEAADKLLAVEPQNAIGLGIRFDALSGLGRSAEATAALEALVAVDRSPNTAARVYNTGVAAVRANDAATAVARFEKALVIDPTLTAAHIVLGDILLNRKDYAQAAAHAEQALSLEPGNARGLALRYDAYRGLGDAAKAQEAFEALKAADPKALALSSFKQGQELFDAGDMQGAIAAYERAVAADPGHARAHYQLAVSCVNAGDNARAKEHLQRFLEIAPDDADAATAMELLAYLEKQ